MSEKKVSFGRIFWPSFLALVLASILITVVMFFILGGAISSLTAEKEYRVPTKSVLHLKLDGELAEVGSSTLDPMSMTMKKTLGLNELLFGFQVAKTDPAIEGIFLEIDGLSCRIAMAREIRNAINDFEKSGKFVVAFNAGEVIRLKEYYISSAANSCYGFPTSMMEFVGLGGEYTYFKNTFDKLGVEMQIIRGKNNDFKSAVEPFFRTNMSDSSRLQTQRYVDQIWLQMRKDIAADRNISPEKLNTIAEQMTVKNPSEAVQQGMMTACKYRDEILTLLAKKTGSNSSEKLKLTSFEKYAAYQFKKNQNNQGSANIAVLVAEGDVRTGLEGLGSEKICRYLRQIRADKNIKTVVLRINSPGGSALASDEIWREVDLLNKKKKVIVSMGDVAASGGYYIAAPASYIFADPTTITGSIGVFGMIPYTGKMLEDKLGLTFDQIKTNQHAVVSTNRKLTATELQIVQNEVDQIYANFLQCVASGRGMSTSEVNRIARGRVWTGVDAKRVGLVDELGGISDAIAYAAKKAAIKEQKIRYYPEQKESTLDKLLELMETEQENVRIQQASLPSEWLNYYKELLALKEQTGIQMRLPNEFKLN